MICFEKAVCEDAEELVQVKKIAFKDEVLLYGFGPTGYDSVEKQIESITNNICYKILEEDKIVGGFSIVDKGNHHYRLSGIYIHLDYQDRGIGTMAIDFIQKEFPFVEKWSLDTPYLSYRNHHFYEKMGFTKIGEKILEEGKEFRLFEYEKIMD